MMFSRIYNRNVDGGNGQGPGKSSRIRITLKDRINSKESTGLQALDRGSLVGHKEGDDSLLVRRNNTIGRIIQNGSQQVFYPVSPNGNFTRHQMRGRYNSNMVQNNHSGIVKYKSSQEVLAGQSTSGRELSSTHSIGSGSDLVSRSSSNGGAAGVGVQQIRGMVGAKAKSMVSSIPLELVERGQAERQVSSKSQVGEIEDSENEGMNSNRDKPGLSFEFYSLSEEPKKRVGLEFSLSREERPVGEALVNGSISLRKERLPDLEILPMDAASSLENATGGRDKPDGGGDGDELRTLMGRYGKEISELVPKLNKSSAFYFVRFNLLLHLAAIVIQCYYRRYLCKKYLSFRKLGPIKLLNASAVQIQACWRSFLTRFGLTLCRGVGAPSGKGDYYWSVSHERQLCEIARRRNSNAACIQKFWRKVYVQNINLEREILASSIFSARCLARETLERFLIGHSVRRIVDSKFKLVPIRWGWSIQDISQIFIIQKTPNGWSEPKKMWFSRDKNLYEYNIFLPNGVHLFIFKVYYKESSGEGEEFKFLCNSSLETTPNEEYQFVNSICVHNKNYTVSAFRHLRSVILSEIKSLFEQDSDVLHYTEDDDLDYIALSPSYKQILDREYSETDCTNSPFKDSDIALNNVVSTPSTNMEYSPEIQHFIH